MPFSYKKYIRFFRRLHDRSYSQQCLVPLVLGLAESIGIIWNSTPQLLFKPNNATLSLPPLPATSPTWESAVRALVNDPTNKVLPVAVNERSCEEEFSVTLLVSGNSERLCGIENVDEERACEALDACVYVGSYAPRVFGVR